MGFSKRHVQDSTESMNPFIDTPLAGLKEECYHFLQGIDFEVLASKESLINALQNLDMQDRNRELAQRVYNTTKIKFEQGLGSSFEVLQADTDFQTAEANYFNALYTAIVAKISYLKAIGKIPKITPQP